MPLSPDKIAARREAVGLTMEQAGERYGFTAHPRQQWYALEKSVKGDPRLGTIERMCIVLKCSVVDILADDSPAMPPRPAGHRHPAGPTRPAGPGAQKRRTPSGSAGS